MATDARPRSVDIQAVIDAQHVSPLQKLLWFLCFLVVAIDGFDSTRWSGFPRSFLPWRSPHWASSGGDRIAAHG